MPADSTLEEICTLVTDGELELALQRLLPVVQARAPRCQNEARLHAAAWNNLRRQARAGTMTEESFRVETAKLTGNLLDFLRDVVTNRHLLPDADSAGEATFEFNYEEDIDGSTFPVSRYRGVPGSWRALADLDCAAVALAERGEPIESWARCRSVRRRESETTS